MSASINTLTPFAPPIVTRNLTELIAFTSTPSPKQNVPLELAVFTKHLSYHLMCQRKYQVTVLQQLRTG